jgi:hypothetical protein
MSIVQTEKTPHQARGRVVIEEDIPLVVSPITDNGPINRQTSKWWMASGIFLFVLAIYVLTSPGRIDIIDGQARFDVAYNWLTQGRPVLRDPWVGSIFGVSGRNGAIYSFYGAPASVLSMPLVGLGLHLDARNIDLRQFLFSLLSSIIGALIAPVLFLFYLELGVPTRKAFLWTMVSSFATMVWPASCTTFDNAQHALFGFSAAYLGFLSGRRDSKRFAFAGGLMAGILILYQEYFLLVIPAFAILTFDWISIRTKLLGRKSSTWQQTDSEGFISRFTGECRVLLALVRNAFRDPGEERSSCLRYIWFVAGVTIGVLVSFAYNDLRFGSLFENGKMRNFATRHPVWGNPISGLPTLLISPGKSLLLYSPPILLGILGIRSLWRRRPDVAVAILAASAALVAFLSCYAGAAGDWCWGPRYLTILLPLWALAFPFVPFTKVRRDVVLAIVGIGLLVQIMAVSVDTQRFFFQRGLGPFFWAEDHWAYFKRSALFARVGETLSLADGPPSGALLFHPGPGPIMGPYTYTNFGPPPQWPPSVVPHWMQHFKIFYLPAPWPLWMAWVPSAARPINLGAWLLALLGIALGGIGLVYHGFRIEPECTDTQ